MQLDSYFQIPPKNITKESFWNLALNEYEYDQSLFQQLENRFYGRRCCFLLERYFHCIYFVALIHLKRKLLKISQVQLYVILE